MELGYNLIKELNMVTPGYAELYRRVELLYMNVVNITTIDILGHLSLDVDDTHAGITWVYVEPIARRRGIAAKLLERAWEITERNELRHIELVVDLSSEQERLVNYYTKFGYEFYKYTNTGGVALWRKRK